MLKSISLLLVGFIFVVFFSCSTSLKINSLKPEADDASPLTYENIPSFIALPITIKLKDIENKTNVLLNGLLYEDKDIEDDDTEIQVWKQAPIAIEITNDKLGNRIKTIMPLKVLIKYRIGTKTLGIEYYKIQEFELDGVVTLISSVNLTNWKLNTKTELNSLEWNQSPTTTIFEKKVPITYLINPAVKIFKSKIERTIDEAVRKSMDFKPNLMTALEKICSPFQINENYSSWLRITPIEIYTTEARLKKDQLSLQMGMKCNIETLIGTRPESKFDFNKITLKAVAKIPNQISANIIAVSSFSDASKIIKKNFAGQEFESGGKKVVVQDIELWHKNGKIVIALDLVGSVNGKIYLSGFPQYDNQSKELYFDDLEYVLDTKNRLMLMANWLAEGLVLQKIKESCRYSIANNLDEGKKTMMTYLQNYSPMPGVSIKGDIKDIQFQKVQLTKGAIIAFLKVNGVIAISVDGLK
jgi:hypothetical protein